MCILMGLRPRRRGGRSPSAGLPPSLKYGLIKMIARLTKLAFWLLTFQVVILIFNGCRLARNHSESARLRELDAKNWSKRATTKPNL